MLESIEGRARTLGRRFGWIVQYRSNRPTGLQDSLSVDVHKSTLERDRYAELAVASCRGKIPYRAT